MRNKFEKQLELLCGSLTEMGALCESIIDRAIGSILNHDTAMADEALTIEEEINQKERDVESLCFKLLLKQQPVAADLRLISAALKMITDMERIGDQAADISEIVKHTDPPLGVSRAHVESMSSKASRMVTESVNAFVDRDLELARSVMKQDDEVDALFKSVNADLIKYIKENPSENAPGALDVFMVSKYLERIGDHAVNIAEWVEFSITGKHKRMSI